MSGYAIKHQDKVFSPEGESTMLAVANMDNHNRELEKQELAQWAACPEQWHVYVEADLRHVTTWLGTRLGTITARSKFRTNISRNMVAIRFTGTNGAEYYGRYGADWSQVCRVRKIKGRTV